MMFSLNELKTIIETRFKMDVSKTSGDTSLEDIGFDSLSQLDLAQAIHKQHGIKISDDDMESISTLDDVVNYVSGKLS
ncbi:hypothetical protein TW75_03980 [Pseudoalteromonas piscicida]|nr:hypothetical protein TW75_03980 [Pseudoalteromonas piscicida]